MSKRRVQLVLLCEDRQHEAFLRRFLEADGWHPRSFRVERCPDRKCAEQWVRARYPEELRKLRAAPHVSKGLVVCVDEDKKGAGRREEQLAEALTAQGMKAVSPHEKVLHAVPARNIETWIAYLDGTDVDEATEYPKLPFERECGPRVLLLKRMWDAGSLRQPAPSSLERAGIEYRARLR
jgi:hypothetical protein